jgi:uncharacterized membrane protein YtjA (UPF0391 family)
VKSIRLVFALIFSIAKSLVAACIFLILACSAALRGFPGMASEIYAE